ncbi:MAG: prepilin-type N-terminal cleavage/methylation domain-containing protein [Actinomycetota bacterium]
MSWIVSRMRTRLSREDGFSLVEAIVGISILALGMLAIAQAITFSLHSSGLARQRLGARAAIEQQIELARALNYDTVVLSDSSPIPHETDPDNPDYFVDQTAQTYDPDGAGPLGYEELVVEPGANPAIQHYQSPVVSGNTTFSVYMYITWVDGETDGLGVADADGDTHDAKRVTVVVTWTESVTGGIGSTQVSSLVSEGSVPFVDTVTANNASPTVACPVTSSADLDYTFTADATDPDGTIVSVAWAITGTGTATGNDFSGTGQVYNVPFTEEGPYNVLTTVYDDDGASANNSLLDCQITAATTSNNAAGNGGPAGTVVINAGATSTNATQVTLTLSSPTAAKMQFSSDGSTWTTKVTYATTSLYTLASGDGTKTVYARFWEAGKYGPWATDTITLDQTAPNGATAFAKVSSVNSGAFKDVTFQWSLPSAPVEVGYRVYYRATTSSGAFTAATCTSLATNRCIVSGQLNRNTSYQTYLVYYDLAGNESAPTSTITV